MTGGINGPPEAGSAAGASVTLQQQWQLREPLPPRTNLRSAPGRRPCLFHPKHQATVVRHCRIGADVDGEDPCQGRQALDNPNLAVLLALAGEGILATEEGAAHATADAVVVGGGHQGGQFSAGNGS